MDNLLVRKVHDSCVFGQCACTRIGSLMQSNWLTTMMTMSKVMVTPHAIRVPLLFIIIDPAMHAQVLSYYSNFVHNWGGGAPLPRPLVV
jgi:hypothetical protein